MSHSLTLADDQINLIFDLLMQHISEIADDIETDDFDTDGKQSGLSPVSFSVLRARFCELASLHKYLTENLTPTENTPTP